MTMNPVVHFEMPAKDKKRVAKFYTKAFGWDISIMGEEYSGYILAMTTESDKNGPKKKGVINGGFFMQGKEKHVCPHVVISVDNLKKSIAAIKKAGGKIMGKETDIPGVGLYVAIKDSEGNGVAVLQAAPRGGGAK